MVEVARALCEGGTSYHGCSHSEAGHGIEQVVDHELDQLLLEVTLTYLRNLRMIMDLLLLAAAMETIIIG